MESGDEDMWEEVSGDEDDEEGEWEDVSEEEVEEVKGKEKKKERASEREIESVRKDKSEMVEAQSNARQQLFQADYKWSVLGSQFEQHIANRNLS